MQDEYTFAAEEGQRIHLNNEGDPVTRTCEGLDSLTWSLESKSSGKALFRDESMESCSTPSQGLGYDLEKGTYTLTIHNRADATVDYSFTIDDADPKELTKQIGKTEVGEVAPGVASVYTFTVDREQMVFFDNQKLDGSCEGADDLNWSLQQEESTVFLFEAETMSGCKDASGPEGITLTPGTYALTVFGYGRPGRYRFTLRPA